MTSIAFLSSVYNFVVLLLFVQFFSAPTCIVCSVIVLMTIEYLVKSNCWSIYQCCVLTGLATTILYVIAH